MEVWRCLFEARGWVREVAVFQLEGCVGGAEGGFVVGEGGEVGDVGAPGGEVV